MAIYPTAERMKSLLAGPADQPVVMVNLSNRSAYTAPPVSRASG